MTVGKVLSLMGRALHPGTSLAHKTDELGPVDALTALGQIKERHGALVLHAKYAGESLNDMRAVVLQMAQAVFATRGWVVHDRKHLTADQTMRLFANQVWREFFGQPCEVCRGHGVLGQKLDSVRHRLDVCGTCSGNGYVLVPLKKHPGFFLRGPCETCRGKQYVQITEALKAGKLRSCTACSGTGNVRASSRARGRALQYDHKHIQRVWVERFKVVLLELLRVELAALYECVEHLYGTPTAPATAVRATAIAVQEARKSLTKQGTPQ